MQVAPNETRLVSRGSGGSWTTKGEAATLAGLAGFLRTHVGRRVVDKTGLTGYFDFTLEFSGSLDTQSDSAPYIVDALREQLGLDLQATTLPIDIVVVDQVDRTPAEN